MKSMALQIQLIAPDKILENSYGEVTEPETLNYRTYKPEKNGLFCEKIFGPSKDWECLCGKYKKTKYKGIICDRCGVEITTSAVRRERMGHIMLAAPIAHIWFFKGGKIAQLLDIPQSQLEKVLYHSAYVVTDPLESSLSKGQVLTYAELLACRENEQFKADNGADAIHKLLSDIKVEETLKECRKELEEEKGQQTQKKLLRRIEILKGLKDSGANPAWMCLTVLPVLPPELRPMVQLDGGRFAASDLNELYRRIVNRNNRLKRLHELNAPDIIISNEKRMLQEAVDALIDNSRLKRPTTGQGNRALKSLSDMLKGKTGRFRQNLLGKRVDYSGRSVIVVGPELKIYQCGLPKEMAIELFKPFVMQRLVSEGYSLNIKAAGNAIAKNEPIVWDQLEKVIREHPVMLNRAPTLHRLGIQAFEPVLVEGKAIKLHPLVCTAYNADFDGDQMAVHVPLSAEAQAECRFLLLSPNNLLKPSDGAPVAVPSQDMVLGIYYLTQEREGAKGEGKAFKDLNEAILAYENNIISLHSRIKVKRRVVVEGQQYEKIVSSTFGRFVFNEIIPQDLGFRKRDTLEDMPELEVDFLCGKKELKNIVEKTIHKHGNTITAEMLDKIKEMGYKYSTKAAISVSISDMTVPSKKQELLEQAQKTVDKITKNYQRGLITEEERYRAVVDTWNETDKELTNELLQSLDKHNNIYMMADSGARGSNQQIKQLAGMRGLMADTTGRTIELPIKSNFREGLDVLEYFMSAHGARKGLSDTALRTADSGYLTRRMVDVSQELIIREMDCSKNASEIPGAYVKAFTDGKQVIESLKDRIIGRFSCEEIKDDKGNVIVKKNYMITPEQAKQIVDTGVKKVKIRTILKCRCHNGICAKCYGADMSSGYPVQVGEAVGIIAAQSIGEPGTQLTMRTFHTGGVAGDDITQGLPRVEELFEARKPKGLAIITEFDGIANIRDSKKKREIIITDKSGNTKAYLIPYGSHIKITEGAEVKAGDELTEGSINPHELLEIKGAEAVQQYLISEVQKVYRLQGVDIADKHIELIARQMFKKCRILDSGDSDLLKGSVVNTTELSKLNEELIKEGKKPAEAKGILYGITKAAMETDSFLSAASFQETTKILADAAIKGKIDPLHGIKENVILGRRIPAGTGFPKYNNVDIKNQNEK